MVLMEVSSNSTNVITFTFELKLMRRTCLPLSFQLWVELYPHSSTRMALTLNNSWRLICHLTTKRSMCLELYSFYRSWQNFIVNRTVKNNKRIIKRTWRLRSWQTSRDYPNDTIAENGQNPETSPGDLKRLAVTQTPVKNHQLTLMWKTLKE